MSVVIDKISGDPVLHDHPVRLVSADPANGRDGQLIINTTDNKFKVYYSNAWQDLHTLTVATPLQGNPIGLLLTLTYANDQ